MQHLKLKKNYNRLLCYTFGCFMFSIGAKFFIDSNLGVDPLDSMLIGISNNLNCKIGTASGGVAIIFLAIWSIWNKKRPIITPFITMALVGYLIDLWNYINILHLFVEFNNYILMIIGLLICSHASALIIMSGIGIRTMDLVALTMINKLSIPFPISKGIIELLFIVTGLLTGGPLGIGTFSFLLLVGPFIQPFIHLNKAILGIEDFGFQGYNNHPIKGNILEIKIY